MYLVYEQSPLSINFHEVQELFLMLVDYMWQYEPN